MKIQDPTKVNYSIPEEFPFPHLDSNSTKCKYEDSLIEVDINNDPFDIKITRKHPSEVIFDSSKGPFLFSDYYTTISTGLTSNHLYGLGERLFKFGLVKGKYTIWPKDANGIEDGDGGNNIYG